MESQDYSLEGRISGSLPPKRPGLDIEVIRITSSTARQFVILSDQPWGAYIHWVGKSVRCREPEPCEFCKKGRNKWRGYIHAIELLGASNREVVIEITHVACVMIDIQLCGQPLRGSQLRMAKTKGGKHGRFVLDLVPRRIDEKTLIAPKPPEILLGKLWEINERKSGSCEQI
jgi:hypothetical protein